VRSDYYKPDGEKNTTNYTLMCEEALPNSLNFKVTIVTVSSQPHTFSVTAEIQAQASI
jgi:hypothetical protein